MKIIRLIARLNVGGPARHVVWLSRELKRPEFETLLVAGTVPPGEEDMSYFAAENGVEVAYIPELSRELSIKDAVSLTKVYRKMLAERPDILHTHTAKAGTVGRVAALLYKYATPKVLIGRPRRLKTVHTFHGHVFNSYYGGLKTRIFISIERLLGRFATDRIVVISDKQLDEINGTYGVGSRDKFSVIPLGLELPAPDSDARAAFRAEVGADDDAFVVGAIGRLTEIKNLEMFVRAAAEADANSRLVFAIVGDGHLRSELEGLSVSLGVGGRLRFVGNRNDVQNVLAGLDAVALVSKNEGTPLSLIEAMSVGVPVISTLVGGVPDLLGEIVSKIDGVEIRERGIGITNSDPKEVVKAADLLRSDPELGSKLKKNALEYVKITHSIERLARDISDLYRSLTGD